MLKLDHVGCHFSLSQSVSYPARGGHTDWQSAAHGVRLKTLLKRLFLKTPLLFFSHVAPGLARVRVFRTKAWSVEERAARGSEGKTLWLHRPMQLSIYRMHVGWTRHLP